jgi:uncharacterized membrane protein
LRYPAALLVGALFGLVGLVLTLSLVLPPELLLQPTAARLPRNAVAAAGFAGLLLAVVAIEFARTGTRLEVFGERVGAAWVTAGFVALYGASGAVLTIGLLTSPDRAGFTLGHMLMTISWAVGALVLLLRGTDRAALRAAGLTLVGAALFKLVFFDLSALDGIARVAAFLIAGLVLLGAGTRYARLVATRQPPA